MFTQCAGRGQVDVAFYNDRVYPALVDWLGNPSPVQAIRQQLIPLAVGTVLEIGAGSGANFPHYDKSKVERLYALEPNRGMLRLADKQRRRTQIDIEFLAFSGGCIPLRDASVDTVVSTFTLCTVSSIEEVLRNVGRVLNPSGLLIFVENTLADRGDVRRWQRRWEPVHRQVFNGLRLTRDIPAGIREAGFRLERVEYTYLSSFPKSWSHCCLGTARRS